MHFLEKTPSRPIVLAIVAISFIGMIAVWLQFLPLEDTMREGGGYGIVDYELAFTAQKVAVILGTWGAEARAAAKRSLLIDYAFMPAYGLFFAAVTLLIARVHTGVLRSIGFALTISSIAAAFFDALENAMLLSILSGPPVPALPPLIAGVAASIKFLLLILPLLYWPVALIALMMRRRS